MRRSFDVIIVGAGPAGTAAALQLARRDVRVAKRTLLLDAHVFPRDKLCGGGLVPESDRFLTHLGIAGGFPDVPIRRIVFEYPGGRTVKHARRFFRVVHRQAFDHALLLEAMKRGVEVRCGDGVDRLERGGDGIAVTTRGGEHFTATVLIGADGARSRVRKALVGGVRSDRFVALETLSRGHDGSAREGGETARFDFRPAASGIRGYAWDFPSIREGERWMNRGLGGLGGATRSAGVGLMQNFEQMLRAREVPVEPGAIEGAGAPLYDPARPQGAERVVLAGDAVGIDPWFGEGISVALGTGILAANATVAALATNHYGFEDHARRVAESGVGWSLRRKRAVADLFYPTATTPGAMGAFFGEARSDGPSDALGPSASASNQGPAS